MNNLLYFRPVALAAALVYINACYTGVDVDASKVAHASFATPEGWEVVSDRPGYIAIVNHDGTKDGMRDRAKIETVPSRVFRGNESDARSYMINAHARRSKDAQEMGMESLFAEVPLEGGGQIYASMSEDPSHFDIAGERPWSSSLAYAREGHVIVMWMTGRADDYTSELAQIVETTSVQYVDK